MGDDTRREYPTIKGLTWHRRQYYSFFTPISWHRFTWLDEREGEIYGPDPDDPWTSYAVTVEHMGTQIVADDLDALAEGFFETLAQLPEIEFELRNQKIAGSQLELETKYTFFDQGATRKCWVRVFYHMTRQITMTAQGSTIEKYDYWLPMFFQSMMTAKVHSTKPTSLPG